MKKTEFRLSRNVRNVKFQKRVLIIVMEEKLRKHAAKYGPFIKSAELSKFFAHINVGNSSQSLHCNHLTCTQDELRMEKVLAYLAPLQALTQLKIDFKLIEEFEIEPLAKFLEKQQTIDYLEFDISVSCPFHIK